MPPSKTLSLSMCAIVVDDATDYLDGFMVPQAMAHLEGHLGECAACREYLEEMRAAIAALADLRHGEISPQLRRALREPYSSVPASAPDY